MAVTLGYFYTIYFDVFIGSSKAGTDFLDGERTSVTIFYLEKDLFILIAVVFGKVSTTRVNSLGAGQVSIGFNIYFCFLLDVPNALLDYFLCFKTGLRPYYI
jgi:hypothetical protein